jgi:hypothetical protein
VGPVIKGEPLNYTFVAIAIMFFGIAVVFFAVGRKAGGGTGSPSARPPVCPNVPTSVKARSGTLGFPGRTSRCGRRGLHNDLPRHDFFPAGPAAELGR